MYRRMLYNKIVQGTVERKCYTAANVQGNVVHLNVVQALLNIKNCKGECCTVNVVHDMVYTKVVLEIIVQVMGYVKY